MVCITIEAVEQNTASLNNQLKHATPIPSKNGNRSGPAESNTTTRRLDAVTSRFDDHLSPTVIRDELPPALRICWLESLHDTLRGVNGYARF